jgi:16S rRNA (cytidine1402-2'-O)-methyltransferase
MLYVVATPIGNLGEMSPRAIEILKNVQLIAAEDTRVTRKLTAHFDINTQLTSCHQHNEKNKSAMIVDRMLKEGIDVALVTDAGTPAISDPGSTLVHLAIEAGIPVTAAAGPCAISAAISVSGFDFNEFTFYGFLPRTPNSLRKKLNDISQRSDIAVIYESPFRVTDLIRMICDELPQAILSVSCDLTKLFEKTIHGSPIDILNLLESNPKAEKGEYCLCLDLRGIPRIDAHSLPSVSIEGRIFDGLAGGKTMREAIEAVMNSGEKKNTVYSASLRVKKIILDLSAKQSKKNKQDRC